MSNDQNRGWIAICGVILAITLGIYVFSGKLALWIGSSLSGLLLVFPLLLGARVNRLTRQQHYRRARQLASLLRWLHPTGGWQYRAKLLLALEIAHQGNLAEAVKLLQRYQKAHPRLARQARALIYWIQADWQGCLHWMKQEISQDVWCAEPELLVYYLRALGETGDLNGLLRTMAMAEAHLKNTGDFFSCRRHHELLNLLRLFVLAFCGQVAAVRQLFQIVLAEYPKPIQKFWLATALMFAEKRESAREQLLALRLEGDLILSNAIDWRLCHPLPALTDVLEPRSWNILARVKSNINQDLIGDHVLKRKQKKPYLTIILILINLVFYVVEIASGGSKNIGNLYKLGALVPTEVVAGQWWRAIAANFLHYGWLHLLTNMVGLYFVGSFAESAFSRMQYLLIYFASGIGSMFLFSLWSAEVGDSQQILVGASAAIMGLIGAIFSLFVQNWLQHKSEYSLRRVRGLLSIIGLQFIFDFIYPSISLTSHLLGLVVGLIFGILILFLQKLAALKS